MIKSATFKVQLHDVNLVSDAELVKLLDRIGDAIAGIHRKISIDSNVQVQRIEPQAQHTAFGDAQVDGYMKVERAKGGVEYFYNANGESHAITKDQYEAAHAPQGVTKQ